MQDYNYLASANLELKTVLFAEYDISSLDNLELLFQLLRWFMETDVSTLLDQFIHLKHFLLG